MIVVQYYKKLYFINFAVLYYLLQHYSHIKIASHTQTQFLNTKNRIWEHFPFKLICLI